jgi:1L-myo-inositol 1-phosphate cytidylyltransferase
MTAFSKPLITVEGKSLLARTVENCRQAGIARIIVVTGYNAELVTAEARRLGRDIETVYNPLWQRSNGLSLYACKDRVDGPFALMMSDHIFDSSILRRLIARPATPGTVSLAVDYKIDDVFDLDDATKVGITDGLITRISKTLPTYDAIDCGVFHCTMAIFDALEQAMGPTGDCSLSEGMMILARRGRFKPFDIGHAWWQDVDTPEMMWKAAELLRDVDASYPMAAHA